jgi:hypothetical protein
MTILLNAATSGEVRDEMAVSWLSGQYWQPRAAVSRSIRQGSITEAESDGKRYLHIIVTNILDPDLVTMRHEFRVANGGMQTWFDSFLLRVFSLASAESIVRVFGANTKFRFSFKLSELPQFVANGNLFYTMCNEDGKVFLCLYRDLQTIGPTLSRGVRVPRGR